MIVAILQPILAFILVLAPLVFFHELGHFLAAKSFGVKVPVFSLGFGPRLFGFRRAETDYRVSLIPLGGYVRMAGDESDENRTGAPDEFLSRPKWQRLVVYVAGAAFNIVLAFLAIWVLFGIYGKEEAPASHPAVWNLDAGSPAERAGIQRGDRILRIGTSDVDPSTFLDTYNLEIILAPNVVKPVVVEREGQRLTIDMETGADPKFGWGSPGWYLSMGGDDPAVLHAVVEGEPAADAGLLAGDRIVAAGGRQPITQLELRILLMDAAHKPLELTVARGGELLDLTVVPREAEDGRGHIGVEFARPQAPRIALSIGQAAAESVRANLAWSKTLFVVLKRLITREVPIKTMSGPIGIAQVASRALQAGPETFLYLLGFFSLQLGILNLMPIPVLDGGHILILGVESVMGRDLSERLKERVIMAGLVFLLLFMSTIIYLDVMKL